MSKKNWPESAQDQNFASDGIKTPFIPGDLAPTLYS